MFRVKLLVSAATSITRRKGTSSDRARKKRRRSKEARSSSVDRQRELAKEVRENEIRGKRGGQPKKSKDSPARRYRAERRRRRKNRERKRGKKRPKNDEKADGRRGSKFKRRMNDAPAALLLQRPDPRVQDSVYSSESQNGTWKGSQNFSDFLPDSVTPTSILQDQLTTEAAKRSVQTTSRYRSYGDTVEREFSKQLEKEISRTQMEDPASLENRILGSSLMIPSDKNADQGRGKESHERKPQNPGKFGNSRYDADKMLGYSRTEEDLPIIDLENEVLARRLKDYNAYMTSSSKLPALQRREEIERRKSAGSHFHGKPIIDGAEFERLGGKKAAATTSTVAYDNDTKGDLSCINGTFVPAPLARHALIKYVK